MSGQAPSDDFFDYVQFFNRSLTSEDKKQPSTLSTKHSSPSSQFNSRTHRLKCFTEFTNSPELNEQAFGSNRSNSNNFTQEDLSEKAKKENKSYEFTYKILFNVGPFEDNKTNKKQENIDFCNQKPSLETFNGANHNLVQEIQKTQQFCLCNLNFSELPTRNIKIMDTQGNLEAILSFAQQFGEIFNVDLCESPTSMVVSFYDISASMQFVNFVSSRGLGESVFISSLNDPAFYDYIIVKETFESKNEDFESIFSLFGHTYEINYLKKYVIVKFSSLRSIKKLEKCLENFRSDSKAQLKFLKNIFLNIPEDFIKRIFSKVVIMSKENCSDMFINNFGFPKSTREAQDICFHEHDKENCPPNLNTFKSFNDKSQKKPLKLTSTVFSLSEISSVNDANSQINQNNKYEEENSLNGLRVSNGFRKDFTIDLDLIKQGNEKRTTVMIRNIPNRYNQESLLRVIDVKFKGMYDFLYLPMDFKNKCNIGYAFVNFISTKCILDFYLEFHNKRWDLLRSEKICCICFARIQGRNQLIKHFKKSNVIHMPLDKNYKPLILPNPTLDSQMFQIHSFD